VGPQRPSPSRRQDRRSAWTGAGNTLRSAATQDGGRAVECGSGPQTDARAYVVPRREPRRHPHRTNLQLLTDGCAATERPVVASGGGLARAGGAVDSVPLGGRGPLSSEGALRGRAFTLEEAPKLSLPQPEESARMTRYPAIGSAAWENSKYAYSRW